MRAGLLEGGSNRFALPENGVDTNLLSPPLSVGHLDTPPFRPADSDQTSLSMKNRRRRRRSRRHRDGLDRASTGDTEEQPIQAHRTRKRLNSTSVPDLRQKSSSQPALSAAGQFLMRQQLQALHVARRKDSIARSVETKRRASLPQKPRRWTMPSKAASTRVLSESPAPVISTYLVASQSYRENARTASGKPSTSHPSLRSSPQAENNSVSTNVGETPAMITLRRASKKRTSSLGRRASLRPNAITSFPPPKFNRTTSTYICSFFGINSPPTSSKNGEPSQTSVRQSSRSTGPNPIASLRKASVTADKVQLIANTVATPAVTQVEFLPLFHCRADQQELLTRSARRCSTTIVSGSSVHEIIWDEHVTSSSEDSTCACLSRQTSNSPKKSGSRDYGRRQSVLVEKLEAQLRDNGLRRASLGSQSSSSSRRSTESDHLGKATLRKLTGWYLGSLTQANDLQEHRPSITPMPDLSHDMSTTADGLFETLQEEGLSATTEHVGFFPPLAGSAGNGQRSSISREQSPHPEASKILVEEPSSMIKFDTPVFSERVSKEKGRARNSSNQFSEPRGPSLYSRPGTAIGIGMGQSSHMRRRSSEAYKPSFSTGSLRVSRQRSFEHIDTDEVTSLLANRDCSSGMAAPSLFVDGQNASGQRAGDTTRERKMSVQDFVEKIEGMSRGQLQRSAAQELEDPGKVGLVRRDSPWAVRRRVSKGAADASMNKGKGKVVSEVGEDGGSASGSGSWLGSMRMMSGEGSEVFV
ncbi:hypothetical protein EPUS_06068 [Endocarpon pusillum Z07020]|uniref:Uncharacterized protein n=1 Tax=Endocarpon pusillum (strain Z07020 / HMAS-L-300199) TaxID=1263415 RepID=U1HT61_ENDPU|nr:uncharacterized protein EPUS_06068 [Endocarpon pusillum Z07020]ERF72439.1 hypothetical protein EPUS_06068 [Endocarpon pusillum Z07020]